MTNQEFVNAVRERLISLGLPVDFVDDQCGKLLTKINELPEESAQKYTQEQNIETFAEKIAKKHQNTSSDTQADTNETATENESDSTKTVEMPKQSNTPSAKKKSSQKSQPSEAPSVEVNTTPVITNTSEMVVVFNTEDNKKKKKNNSLISLSFGNGITSDNPHPDLLFVCMLVMLAPVGILLLGAYFVSFLAIFVALAASIIVMIAAIIGIVAVGSLLSISSLLYGATQIISEPRFVGIHEIGFGLLVAGITILASVILYNIAIRLVPFIYAKLITFIGFSGRKLKEIFVKAKKGCENL